jgi:hypothetical protein
MMSSEILEFQGEQIGLISKEKIFRGDCIL